MKAMTFQDGARPADGSTTTGNGTISVSVKLFADLRKYLPKDRGDPFTLALPRGATVEGVLAALGIPADYELTAGINDELAKRDSVLNDGDALMLLSPMEGG
jgi:molybdopterin converting factor small subunit